MKCGIARPDPYLIILIVLACITGFYLGMVKTSDHDDPVIKKTCYADEGVNEVWVDGGTFIMGDTRFYPEEGPLMEINVDGFWIDKHEVTNAQFARFVEHTGYVTTAERNPESADFPGIPLEQLVPGSVVFSPPLKLTTDSDPAQWWKFVPGANWRHPYGPGSRILGLEQYPVIHVSYEDALAYARWAGRELPNEAQWEFAARSGFERSTYSWGDKEKTGNQWMANTWQGPFPMVNSVEDGYVATSPVGCYPSNNYGLYDMTGNVWEWVTNWYYPVQLKDDKNNQPPGYGPHQPGRPVRVIKGGSYLCSKNYCLRYRPAARQPQEPGLTTSHIGFRTVRSKK